MSLLKIIDLVTCYDTPDGLIRAVDGGNLTVEQGETVGLVGESGCGKSTLGLSIMRLIRDPGRIESGQIVFKGTDLLQLTEKEVHRIRGKDIAMIFQDPMTYLNPVMKIEDQIAEVIRTHTLATKEGAKQEVKRLLKIVNAPGIEGYYPHQLSGGLRQRALISMTLACNPSLIIADEPTTALDLTVQAQILELLRQLAQETKSSMLLITHNLGVVAGYSQRVYVMYAGKVVEGGRVEDIFRNHKHPYTTALIQSARSLQQRENILAIPGEPPNLANPPPGCRFHPRCSHTIERCRREEPQIATGEQGHFWYCWLHAAK